MCWPAGPGAQNAAPNPVSERLQLQVPHLEAAINQDLSAGRKPFCVVATAGTTSSGAIDDIVSIHEIRRRYNIWLHVDGAYGAAVLFSDQHRSLVQGIEQADSVTFDPHKWLAMPFSNGLVLTRACRCLAAHVLLPLSIPGESIRRGLAG